MNRGEHLHFSVLDKAHNDGLREALDIVAELAWEWAENPAKAQAAREISRAIEARLTRVK